MKELLIEKKEQLLDIYVFAIFLLPWLIFMIYNFRFMNGIRHEMGAKFWFTIFPNQETAKLVHDSTRLSSLKHKRNVWFAITFVVWIIGAIGFVLLLGWLNGKF